MKNLFIISVLIFSNYTFALNCSSITDGNWEDPLIWSCGVVPSAGDTITITVGHTVTVSSNIDLNGTPVVIYINGVLLFDSPGAKLRLECGSSVVLSATGEVRDSGNGTPSHSIRICGSDVWTGPSGSLFGPIVLVGGPLSIELIDFSVEQKRGELYFEWSTSSESNNDYFTIESSSDNLNWNELGFHDGAGNSNETIEYNLVLNNDYNDQYFRLRQTDFDGTTSVSNVISIKNIINSSINVFPNPVKSDYLVVETEMEKYNVRIISLTGKVVYHENDINQNVYKIDGLNLENGAYIVELSNQNEVLTSRVIKN